MESKQSLLSEQQQEFLTVGKRYLANHPIVVLAPGDAESVNAHLVLGSDLDLDGPEGLSGGGVVVWADSDEAIKAAHDAYMAQLVVVRIGRMLEDRVLRLRAGRSLNVVVGDEAWQGAADLLKATYGRPPVMGG